MNQPSTTTPQSEFAKRLRYRSQFQEKSHTCLTPEGLYLNRIKAEILKEIADAYDASQHAEQPAPASVSPSDEELAKEIAECMVREGDIKHGHICVNAPDGDAFVFVDPSNSRSAKHVIIDLRIYIKMAMLMFARRRDTAGKRIQPAVKEEQPAAVEGKPFATITAYEASLAKSKIELSDGSTFYVATNDSLRIMNRLCAAHESACKARLDQQRKQIGQEISEILQTIFSIDAISRVRFAILADDLLLDHWHKTAAAQTK